MSGEDQNGLLNRGGRRKRVLYVQFTNPGAYPPLEHSSRILADAGFDIVFLGTGALGATGLRFPPHPRIRVRQMPFVQAGALQKVAYAIYCLWVFGWCLVWRPGVIYGSDPFSCVPLWAVSKVLRTRVVYHEHDSPREMAKEASLFWRWIGITRTSVTNSAELVVLPNAGRVEELFGETGLQRVVKVVWNCPRRDEVDQEEHTRNGPLRLLYHGSLVPERVPATILGALAKNRDAELTLVGYETAGSKGYVNRLLLAAKELGIEDRVFWVGAMSRMDLMRYCRTFDVGMALMPMVSDDVNLRMMTGASNKPFDYLSQGLALIVSDLPDWKEMYFAPGYGLTCDPRDPESISAAIQWYGEHRAECRAMGEAGRQRVLAEWNYERQFRDVLAEIVRLSA